MRLARVAIGSSARPVVALERDGALYDVAELERIFDTRFSPERMPNASDFHTRAIALACAGLEELDERLLAGDRPTEARLLAGEFVWLPPCDTDRAHYLRLAPDDEPSAEPLHRLGDARALLGHESVVPVPSGIGDAAYELGLAAVLGEAVTGASDEEAERAILGYAILNGWSGSAAHEREGWVSRPVPAQLGPVLVTTRDVGDLGRLRAQVRVDGAVVASPLAVGTGGALGSSIAWLSRYVDLRGGDVIAAGRAPGGSGRVRFGAIVELAVERLGKLEGQPLRRAA